MTKFLLKLKIKLLDKKIKTNIRMMKSLAKECSALNNEINLLIEERKGMESDLEIAKAELQTL